MSPTDVLAPICTAIAMVLVWPQVLRVRRIDSVAGLSAFGTLHGLTGCVLWTLYGVAEGVVPVVLANGGIGLALLMIGQAQVRHRALPAAVLAGWLVLVTAVGLVLVGASPAFTGWLAGAIGVTSILPQVARVLRATDLSAVSRPTYALICTSCALWAVYGVLIGDAVVLVSNLLIFPCAAFVLLRAARAQRADDLAPVGA